MFQWMLQLEWEDSQRIANRRLEREQGRRDATEDLSEDLSEGEKGDGLGEIVQPETPRRQLHRNLSNVELWYDDKKENRLYVVLIRYFSVFFFSLLLPLTLLCVRSTYKECVDYTVCMGWFVGKTWSLVAILIPVDRYIVFHVSS